MIEQRHLRQILAIVEHGSFRKAATALHMSQPALSKSIRTLEDQLSVRLLDRQVRPVQPTAFGLLFVEQARLATNIVEELDAQMRRIARLQQGMVRIGLTRVAGQTLIRKAVSVFANRHPEIRLQIDVGNHQEMRERFETLRLDLLLSDEGDHKNRDGVQWLSLGIEPFVFVVRKDHPLMREPDLTLARLLRYPTILPQLPEWALDWTEANLVHEDPELTARPMPAIICQSHPVINEVLLTTDHLSVGPLASFHPYLDTGELVVLEPAFEPPTWRPLVAFHGRLSLSPATQAFLVCLLESRGIEPPPQFVDASPA